MRLILSCRRVSFLNGFGWQHNIALLRRDGLGYSHGNLLIDLMRLAFDKFSVLFCRITFECSASNSGFVSRLHFSCFILFNLLVITGRIKFRIKDNIKCLVAI